MIWSASMTRFASAGEPNASGQITRMRCPAKMGLAQGSERHIGLTTIGTSSYPVCAAHCSSSCVAVPFTEGAKALRVRVSMKTLGPESSSPEPARGIHSCIAIRQSSLYILVGRPGEKRVGSMGCRLTSQSLREIVSGFVMRLRDSDVDLRPSSKNTSQPMVAVRKRCSASMASSVALCVSRARRRPSTAPTPPSLSSFRTVITSQLGGEDIKTLRRAVRAWG
mmetsp:Transcript_43763/g.102949  ORF Transcript_43763/g.102949 Transcript_43763/m.102949 type:complete len:223 (+) Transcript_43763:280-948(+)